MFHSFILGFESSEMDPEHNIDSDTSDSWSVIDVNDNEHADVADLSDGFTSYTLPVKYQWSTTSDTNIDEKGVDCQCGNAIHEISITNNSQKAGTSSTEDPKIHQDCQVLYKGKVFENDCDLGRISSDFDCSKTSFSGAEKVEIENELKDFENDTDCISVISESECNDLKLNAYETDEIWEEKVSENCLIGKTQPNVLKRKRKRLKLNCRESSEESVSSDFMVPDGKYYSDIQNIDYKESNNEMQVTEYQNAPVYRHYRNNLANTVLTLAMGVIFIGVACIAIGHFLGVHDAQHTAGEMMETLKRLQMENVLLHTRLAQLSRAFFSRGSNNLEFRANVEPENCLDKYIQQNINGENENNVNDGSPIKNSIFFRGGSFDLSTNVKEPSNELCNKDYDKIKVLDENQGESNFFNISKYEEKYSKPPRSSTIPIKIGCVYNEFLPSGKNFHSGNEKFAREDDQISKWKRSAESKHCIRTDGQLEKGQDDCLAVREKDLSRFRWFLLQKKKKGLFRSSEGEAVYKFPQPEGFYKCEDEDKRSEKGLKLEEVCDELKLVRYSRDKKSGEKSEGKERKFEQKKDSAKVTKDRKRDDEDDEEENDPDDSKSRESAKKREKFAKKTKDNVENYSKSGKKYKMESIKKNGKMKEKECRKKGNRECNFKPHSKRNKETDQSKERDDRVEERKEKEKYLKGEKVKKVTIERDGGRPRSNKKPRNFRLRKTIRVRSDLKFSNDTDCENYGNRTSGWFDKWARGREKCRRNQKVSDWQFDRAKNRAASRIGDAYWQFSRALARESSRKDSYVHIRKRDGKYKGFSSESYSWI